MNSSKCYICKKKKMDMIRIAYSTIGVRGRICMDCLITAMPVGKYGEGDR